MWLVGSPQVPANSHRSTLVRAAQLVDLVVLTDAKEQEKAIRYLVQMYFGLEERYKQTHSNKNPGGQYF